MPTLTSKIRLCKDINVDRNYVNVLNYTEQQMLALCESQTHLVASANDYSFIRNRGTISTNFSYDDAIKSNYIAFQNKDYSNKWFFAWIDDVQFVGENNTEIRYTVDSWSTWFDSWTAKPCWTIREHTNDDTIGNNTELENLDVGDVKAESITTVPYNTSSGFYICMSTNYIINDNTTGSVSELPADKGTKYSGIAVYNNVVFGTKIILFYIGSTAGFTNVSRYIKRTNNDGEIASIENMFVLPGNVINQTTLTLHTAYEGDNSKPFNFYTMPQTTTADSSYVEIDKITSFSGLTIKNNKCFTYPYNYLLVSNGQGSSNIYKYENFYSTKCKFNHTFAVCIGGSGRVLPCRYKENYGANIDDSLTVNPDESIPIGKFPTCSWSSDAFINWLTQNGVNIAVNGIFNILGAVSGIAGAGMTAKTGIEGQIGAKQQGLSASQSVGGFFGSLNQALLLPNIQGAQPTGDVIWSEDRNTIYYKQMRVKDQYMLKIDDYFTRFGYKVNRLKVPNITGRTYWNYIEIADSDEIGIGSVPERYWSEINNACHKGVTIWHNHANIGNFNLNNTIVS